MTKQTKIHDGIVGAIVLTSAALAWQHDVRWVGLAALTGVIMLSSTLTGFCPVHFLVGKVVRD